VIVKAKNTALKVSVIILVLGIMILCLSPLGSSCGTVDPAWAGEREELKLKETILVERKARLEAEYRVLMELDVPAFQKIVKEAEAKEKATKGGSK
jgi:hypothetical protein